MKIFTNEAEAKFIGSYNELPSIDVTKTDFPRRAKKIKVSTRQLALLLEGEYFDKIFRKSVPQYFVVYVDRGQKIYVDTEGYDYARYMARNKVK